MDIENLVDFFEIKMLDARINRYMAWRMVPGGPPLQIESLVNVLSNVTIYSFNGLNYDLPILTLALYGADLATLKYAGDLIIERGMKPWDFYKHFGIRPLHFIDHVDVMEVAAGVRIGLKMYAGRCHAPKMQDLPVDPKTPLPFEMREPVSEYCNNDLDVTHIMRKGLKERLALREAISKKYKIDVRSKSDAQIAEAVIKAEVLRMRREEHVRKYPEHFLRPEDVPYEAIEIQRRYIQHGYTFKYAPPDYIRYATKPLQELLNVVRNADFLVADKEEQIEMGIENPIKTGVKIPAELKGRDIRIGRSVYRLGIGGLHSQESSVAHHTIPGVQSIWDVDVTSYYPSLILNMGMVPAQIGEFFAIIYRAIYERRLLAKSEAKRLKYLADCFDGPEREEMLQALSEFKTEEGGLKIVLNGTFGKLFSKYSIFYAPEFGIATTMSGQLSLLMLIEMCELSGIRCVSANTDGVVLIVPHGMEQVVKDIIKWWEKATSLGMEESHYQSIYARDVNNYIAIKEDGEVKRKGIFAPPGLNENKHPDKAICADAVVEFLSKGTPIEVTIRNCQDIRKFLQVRAVKGGGVYINPLDLAFGVGEPKYLGKAVRWYYGTNAHGHIEDKSSGNKVAGSDGVVPIMQLPESLPADINYQHYENIAREMLKDIGA